MHNYKLRCSLEMKIPGWIPLQIYDFRISGLGPMNLHFQVNNIATHLPFCAQALSLNIYLSPHTYSRLPHYQGLRTLPVLHWPLLNLLFLCFPFLLPTFPLSVILYHCCKCTIVVLSYEGMILGLSVVFV